MPRALAPVLTSLLRAHRARRDEKGAILILSVAGVVLALVASALAVDLGRQAHEKKADQLIADLAALDAAREIEPIILSLPGVTLDVVIADVQSAAEESAERNGFDLAAEGHSLTTEVGHVDDDKAFTPGGTPVNAVRAFVTSPIDYAFGVGGRSLTATAVAKMIAGAPTGDPGQTGNPWWWPVDGFPGTEGSPGYPHFPEQCCDEDGWALAGFDLGSALASGDFDDVTVPVLNRVFGEMIGGNADLLSWSGLGNANVTMEALRRELAELGLDVGTPQQLLAADLTLAQLFTATANALNEQGNSEATAAANLFGGSLGIIAQSTTTTTFKLADIMSFEQGSGDEVAAANIKVRNLVVAAAEAANGDNVISVPDVGITIPGVARTSLELQIVEPQQHVLGPVGTSGSTAQVRFTVTPLIESRDVSILGLTNPKVTGAFPFLVESAGATGTVGVIDCYTPDLTVGVDTRPANGSGSGTLRVTYDPPLLPEVEVMDVPTIATMPSIAERHTDLTFAYATEFHPYWDGSKRAGTYPLNIAGSEVTLNGDPTVLTLPIGVPESDVVDAVIETVRRRLAAVENRVVNPLVKGLGLTAGVAEVTATDLMCVPDAPPLEIPVPNEDGSLGTPPSDGGETGGETGGTDGSDGSGTPGRFYPVLVG